MKKIYKPAEMTVYYAHPMSWYGTELERDDVGFLQSKFKAIVNPSTDDRVLGAIDKLKARGGDNTAIMDWFGRWIPIVADVVAFRTFKDGMLGAGVGREIFTARIHNMHIDKIIGGYERFPGDGVERWLIPSDSMTIMNNLLTVEETKRRVKEGLL